MFKPLKVTPVSISFEADDQRPYYSDEVYDVYLNGELYKEKYDRNVITVFDLKPDSEYLIRLRDEEFKIKTSAVRKIINVLDEGVIRNEMILNTKAIQKLLDECDNDLLVFPKGTYYTGPLQIRSNTCLYFEKGAELLGSEKREDYPIISAYNEDRSAVNASWEGEPFDCFMSLLSSFDSENITLVGEGTINGNADKGDWWIDPLTKRGAWRGNNVFFNRCKNVSFIGLNIINSPSWNLHPFYSDDLDFIDLTLRSIPTSPNTDGFDPESCRNVRLLGTRIYVGDDCVAIKSGKKIMADEYYRPCEDLLIRNCYMGEGHGGVVFGSESSCGVRNVDVSKCIFKNTDRGLRIKTKRGRGYKAVVENVSFDNILMDGVESCFVVNMYYYLSRYGYDDYADSKEYREVSEQTPHVGEFHFKNIECLNTKVCAGYFYGLPESRIDLISLENVKVTYDQDYSEYKTPAMIYECEKVNKGPFYFYNVEKVELSEVYLEGQKLEEVTIHNN